jgi:hypothetical protein
MFIEAKILEKSAALSLSFGKFGITRQANLALVETDADKNMLKMTKKLLDSKEYKAICTHQGLTKSVIRKKSVPISFLPGTYLFNVDTIETIDKYIKERINEEDDLVDKFCAVYLDQKEAAKFLLNGQFDETNYPPVETVRATFSITGRWVKFGIPDNLPESIFQEEKAKAEKAWAEATDAITVTLRKSFQELIAYAADKLKVVPGEKPKVFRDSLIENVKEFIQTFNSRNLTNDTQLESLVSQANDLLKGFLSDPDVVRKNTDVRVYTAEKFEEIRATLDTMLIDRPSRKFAFDEAAYV